MITKDDEIKEIIFMSKNGPIKIIGDPKSGTFDLSAPWQNSVEVKNVFSKERAKMNYYKLTRIVILVAIALLIGYDVFVYFAGKDATISQIILSAGLKYPTIPFAAGVLCGHFFWPNSKAGDDKS